MANKLTGVTKAAVAGALFGSAIGMVAVPRAHQKKKHRRHNLAENASNTLRTVGVAMENVADIISR
ncbi:MAG: hypothetical protein IJ428_00180 [Clostridia bacterium]|nr:hypothetical protein [Clostridia bacterium]